MVGVTEKPEIINPASRRDTFIDIATAVTNHGLPEPEQVALFNITSHLYLKLANCAALKAWSSYLGAGRVSEKLADDGEHRIATAAVTRNGWHWSLTALEDAD